jgi:hypothetical protein
MINMPSFINIGSAIQKLMRGGGGFTLSIERTELCIGTWPISRQSCNIHMYMYMYVKYTRLF